MTKNVIAIAFILILLTAIGSLPLLANRWQAEENDRQVEIAIPGEWVLQKGKLQLAQLQLFKEAGATTVLLEAVLPKPDDAAMPGELLTTAFKSAALALREQHGWEVMAYIAAERFPVQEEFVKELFKELSAAGIKRVQFAGMEVPGYTSDLEPIANSLIEYKMHAVLVKSQQGALALSRQSGYQSIRSLFFNSQQLQSMTISEAVDTFELGVRERGIRLVTFMPQRGGAVEGNEGAAVKRTDYESHVQAIIEQLHRQLKDEYRWGDASPIAEQYSEPSKLWRTLPVVGIGALFLLLAGSVFEALSSRIRTVIILLIAAGTAAIWVLWMAAPAGWSGRIESVIALWGAIAAPSAAVLWMRRWHKRKELSPQEMEAAANNGAVGKNRDIAKSGDIVRNGVGNRSAAIEKRAVGVGHALIKAVAGYAAAVAITSAGIIYVSALLSDIAYLAYIDLFRGVKLLYVGPITIIIIGLLLQGDWFNTWWGDRRGANGAADLAAGDTHRSHLQPRLRSARDTANSRSRKRRNALFIGAALVAGGAGMAYLLARTGNSDMVLPYEGELRQLLSDLFGVRPRTKEWLIGFPLLMIAACMVARYRRGIWLLPLGAIGLCSMVNTFTHLHSPLSISLTRSWTGVLLGGAIGVLFFILADCLWKKRDRQQDVNMEGN
ncbi:hypothetical protein PAECIP111893_04306 [Paenibacillus plantiphilus]|uniref:Uncharacterized protein n=1 Tax=Paenibacillus plantiphilus TaxID=2905650 RepID=A0ABM9CLJ6_9BACL|nr:DUF5693 family protein [Paenibacillus plantiphilus]CAH1217780.1 hypothetical protein PAECIP111893_04306 [Paenibacillus plantiphilus]